VAEFQYSSASAIPEGPGAGRARVICGIWERSLPAKAEMMVLRKGFRTENGNGHKNDG
jgi:hypothetical protein